jgi:hypothetical protein
MPKQKGRPRIATGKSLVMARRSRVEQAVLMPAYLQPQLRAYVKWVAGVEGITEDEAMGSVMEVGVGGLIENDRDFHKHLDEEKSGAKAAGAPSQGASSAPNGKSAGPSGTTPPPPAKSNGAPTSSPV